METSETFKVPKSVFMQDRSQGGMSSRQSVHFLASTVDSTKDDKNSLNRPLTAYRKMKMGGHSVQLKPRIRVEKYGREILDDPNLTSTINQINDFELRQNLKNQNEMPNCDSPVMKGKANKYPNYMLT